MKWSFDDYIVEEELPSDAFVSSMSVDVKSRTSFVLRLLSEGVPDTVVERQLRERLPRHMPFHFLSPVDFVSCASRYVWLRCDGAQAAQLLSDSFQREQLWHTGTGDVYVSPLQEVRVDPKAEHFPLHLLPSTRYTVTLRNIQGSLGDVLPQLRSVAQNGFLNYSHAARHGVGLYRVYKDTTLLLRREYGEFLRNYLRRLTEGTTQVEREMPVLQEVLASPRSSRRDWSGVVEGMEAAVKCDAQAYARTRQTGVYPPHHDLLLDFVRRAADVAPRHHDSAQIIREAVRPLVLQEALHAITDVHFNALASLRWQRGGDAVAVGDIVRVHDLTSQQPAAADSALDVFVGAADHINGAMLSSAHQEWSALSLEQLRAAPTTAAYRRIATKAEAAQYRLTDVVLPTFGRHVAHLPLMSEEKGDALFATLAKELRVEGLAEMRLAPRAAFRPLLQLPNNMSFYLVDEKRGWDWEEDAGAALLKASLYHDQDGILRYRSPMSRRTGKNMVARLGIRDDTARRFFLKPAQKLGMTCVMQFTLPAGSHATSAIREAFMMATLSPSAIFRLLTARWS
ncbi:pseudouridine synthase, putative [Leishmania panamensis]|uniref:Pseudouridine synthase, putative n=1 Tax=Leishmania panamensis TaxID=5679 RepID=A0A088S0T4_LEIPA|nr:pseudouridine synthase, putative [Leishmania panamensis]AIO01874.1 pseudouridine synthase, putative [Leishmania panamensis]